LRPDVILDVFTHWKSKQFRTARILLTDCTKQHGHSIPREAGSLDLVDDTHGLLGTTALYWNQRAN